MDRSSRRPVIRRHRQPVHTPAPTAAVQIEPLELRRLLSVGDLDFSFSGDGKLDIDVLGTRGGATSIAVQSDGKAVVAGLGTSPSGKTSDAIVIRYNTDGTIDSSFGVNGVAHYDLGGNERFNAVAIMKDGSIVAGGTIFANRWAIAKFKSNGTLDLTFGGGDGVRTGDGDITGIATAGTSIFTIAGDDVRKHVPNGLLDTSFGNGGSIHLTSPSGLDNISLHEIEIASDNSIVVAGEADRPAPLSPGRGATVFRVTPTGGYDTSFAPGSDASDGVSGQGGAAITEYGASDFARGLDVGADNDIFLGVRSSNGKTRMLHLDEGGEPIAAFGNTASEPGTVPLGFAALHDVLVQPDGKPYASGSIPSDGNIDIAITRRTTVFGNPDPTLSADGFATADLALDSQAVANTAMGRSSDGIFVLASGIASNRPVARLIKFRAGPSGFDGSIDLDSENRLVFTGSSGDDAVLFSRNGDAVRVIVGNNVFDYALSDVTGIIADGGEGNDRITVATDLPLGATLIGGSGNDKLIGGDRNDLVVGNSGADTLLGGSSNDRIAGNGGNDLIFGEAGADTITGSAGADYIDGGSSNDNIDGGEGIDTLLGQSGDDFITSADGFPSDRIFGGGGTDTADADDDDVLESIEINLNNPFF